MTGSRIHHRFTARRWLVGLLAAVLLATLLPVLPVLPAGAAQAAGCAARSFGFPELTPSSDYEGSLPTPPSASGAAVDCVATHGATITTSSAVDVRCDPEDMAWFCTSGVTRGSDTITAPAGSRVQITVGGSQSEWDEDWTRDDDCGGYICYYKSRSTATGVSIVVRAGDEVVDGGGVSASYWQRKNSAPQSHTDRGWPDSSSATWGGYVLSPAAPTPTPTPTPTPSPSPSPSEEDVVCGEVELSEQDIATGLALAAQGLGAAEVAWLEDNPCALAVDDSVLSAGPAAPASFRCDYDTGGPQALGTAMCTPMNGVGRWTFPIRTGAQGELTARINDLVIIPVSANGIRDHSRPMRVFVRSRVSYDSGQIAPPTTLAKAESVAALPAVPGFKVQLLGTVDFDVSARGDSATSNRTRSNAGRINPDGSCKTGETCYANFPYGKLWTVRGLVRGLRHELEGDYTFGAGVQGVSAVARQRLY